MNRSYTPPPHPESTDTSIASTTHGQLTVPALGPIVDPTTGIQPGSVVTETPELPTIVTTAHAGTFSAVPAPSSPSISVSSTEVPRHTAALAGGIAGGILGAGVLTFLLYFLAKHRRKRSENA